MTKKGRGKFPGLDSLHFARCIAHSQLLTNLRFIRGLDPHLLIAVQTDMFAPLDDDCSDAKCRTHSGSDGRSDRAADNSPDNQTGSRRTADFRGIALERALADGRALGVNQLDVVAFDRHYFCKDRAEITPPTVVEDDAVERQQQLAAAFNMARCRDFGDAALDRRSRDLRWGHDLRRKLVARAAPFGAEIFPEFDDQLGLARDDDGRVGMILI